MVHEAKQEELRQKYQKLFGEQHQKLMAENDAQRDRNERAKRKVQEELEAQIAELEQKVQAEQRLRHEMEKMRRKAETELEELKDSKRTKTEEIHLMYQKSQEEITSLLTKVDQDAHEIDNLQKQSRSLEAQLEEIRYEADNEKQLRQRAERAKRDASGEMDQLKAELAEVMDKAQRDADQLARKEEQLKALQVGIFAYLQPTMPMMPV